MAGRRLDWRAANEQALVSVAFTRYSFPSQFYCESPASLYSPPPGLTRTLQVSLPITIVARGHFADSTNSIWPPRIADTWTRAREFHRHWGRYFEHEFWISLKFYCESPASSYSPPPCKAYPITILLHDYCAIYAPQPTQYTPPNRRQLFMPYTTKTKKKTSTRG